MSPYTELFSLPIAAVAKVANRSIWPLWGWSRFCSFSSGVLWSMHGLFFCLKTIADCTTPWCGVTSKLARKNCDLLQQFSVSLWQNDFNF